MLHGFDKMFGGAIKIVAFTAAVMMICGLLVSIFDDRAAKYKAKRQIDTTITIHNGHADTVVIIKK